ncbi:hypothetical protein JZ751_018252 [Albula glossodonta]|uniref:Uncharacterized protein n=1 Tax=Albula glossodonta TaxID=121402 RepID=A0A8T2NNJ4_9TELE|nr:hypothetical protein JZ751_018252 [Albula glossodonta]
MLGERLALRWTLLQNNTPLPFPQKNKPRNNKQRILACRPVLSLCHSCVFMCDDAAECGQRLCADARPSSNGLGPSIQSPQSELPNTSFMCTRGHKGFNPSPAPFTSRRLENPAVPMENQPLPCLHHCQGFPSPANHVIGTGQMKSLRLTRVMRCRGYWREEVEGVEVPAGDPTELPEI